MTTTTNGSAAPKAHPKVPAEISFLRPVHSGKDRAKLAHKILHVCNKHKWDRSGGAIAGSSRIGGRPGCRFRAAGARRKEKQSGIAARLEFALESHPSSDTP